MSTTLRKFLLVFSAVLALICIAVIVFVRVWLDPLLKEKLEDMTAESSQGMYQLKLDRLHINLFAGTAELNKIQLSTDSTRWDSIRQMNPDETPLKVELKIRRLKIKNLHLIQYWRTKELSLNKILVYDPEIALVSIQDTALSSVCPYSHTGSQR